MNKLIAIMAIFLLLGTVAVSAVTPTTMVYGQVTDEDSNPVIGAHVTVTCDGNDLLADTDSDGMYYVYYPAALCDVDDTAYVHVVYGDFTGDGEDIVDYSQACRINVAEVNIQIPEFGVIAAGVALIGAIGIFAIRRKN